MQMKMLADVTKALILAIAVSLCFHANAQAQEADRSAEYRARVASIESFNDAQREAGIPEMPIPTFEDWLETTLETEANALLSVDSDATPSEPSKKDRMLQWLNTGVRTARGEPSTIAQVEGERRERLWVSSANLLVAHRREMEDAREWVRQHGFAESGRLPDGGVIGLVGIRKGIPQYNVTFNAQAADTISVDELWPGGSTGLALSGTNLLLGIWDGGDVQTNHYAFTYGGPDRATDQDGVSSLPIDLHPTAVAGVMAASGLGYTNARGMAYSTDLWTYD